MTTIPQKFPFLANRSGSPDMRPNCRLRAAITSELSTRRLACLVCLGDEAQPVETRNHRIEGPLIRLHVVRRPSAYACLSISTKFVENNHLWDPRKLPDNHTPLMPAGTCNLGPIKQVGAAGEER